MLNRKSKTLFFCLLAFCLVFIGCQREDALDDDFIAAQEADAAQDWAQAARLTQRYLRTEMDPEKRWVAWNLLVDASANMGEISWVIDYWESMLLEFGDDAQRAGLILRELGQLYEKTQDWPKATAVWLQLLETEELSADAAAEMYQGLARFNQNSMDFDLAKQMFEQCVAYAQKPALKGACLYSVADVLSAEEKLDESLSYVDQVLALPDEVAEAGQSVRIAQLKGMAYLLQGDIFQQKNKAEEARAAFEKALRLHPNPPVVEIRLKALEPK